MNNLFEQEEATAIINRLNALKPDATRLWGKMTVAQMLAHCQVPMRGALGDIPVKQSF